MSSILRHYVHYLHLEDDNEGLPILRNNLGSPHSQTEFVRSAETSLYSQEPARGGKVLFTRF